MQLSTEKYHIIIEDDDDELPPPLPMLPLEEEEEAAAAAAAASRPAQTGSLSPEELEGGVDLGITEALGDHPQSGMAESEGGVAFTEEREDPPTPRVAKSARSSSSSFSSGVVA